MKGIWNGIKEIREQATKVLVRTTEEGYQFYSAPKGHKLILSGTAICPSTWKEEIKDLGWYIEGGRTDRIFYRGFDRGRGQVISDDEAPKLELVEV